METDVTDHAGLLRALEQAIGAGRVRTDSAALSLAAADIYSAGPAPVAVVRPDSPANVVSAVAVATARGYAAVPRGGGLSYTSGYRCEPNKSVLFDLAGLDRIVEISETDMYVVVETGVTWRQLYEALAPRGLRLPFFGTFSGAGATVGGGLSHGALFFGSARHGSAAEMALGLQVATADGKLLTTGQWALATSARPVFRNFGPDMTGLFLHDGGAFGIKTKASLRLIKAPAATGYLSFAFPALETAGAALSGIARAGLAEDAYVLDPAAVAATIERERERGIGAALAAVRAVARSAGGGLGAIRALAELAAAGRGMVPQGAFTLHCVMAGSSKAAVSADMNEARTIASEHGGRSIAATIPRMARADPFPNLDGVLGKEGARWAALNAKVAHSEGVSLIEAHRRLMEARAGELTAQGVSVNYLLSALGNHSFSFETVFHWKDAWMPIHSHDVDPSLIATYAEPEANPAARALVGSLREETVQLFREFGAASNQIGRTYPYVEALNPDAAALARGLKALLDPKGAMNPGVLGL